MHSNNEFKFKFEFIGCGNGKNLSVNPRVVKIGLDNCSELLQLAASSGYEVFTADCLSLPLRSSCFDAVICIAVIHHLSTVERRVQALKELLRVLSVGGRLLVYVWAFEQKTKQVSSCIVTLKFNLSKMPIYGNALSAGSLTYQAARLPFCSSAEQNGSWVHETTLMDGLPVCLTCSTTQCSLTVKM